MEVTQTDIQNPDRILTFDPAIKDSPARVPVVSQTSRAKPLRFSDVRKKPQTSNPNSAYLPPMRGRGSGNRGRGSQRGYSGEPHYYMSPRGPPLGWSPRRPPPGWSPRRPPPGWHDCQDDYRHDDHEYPKRTPLWVQNKFLPLQENYVRNDRHFSGSYFLDLLTTTITTIPGPLTTQVFTGECRNTQKT